MSDITTANIRWRDGQPESVPFGDVYYSRDDGLAESQHVFLAGNNLADRWGCLPAGADFTVMETGFGTGLNFLAAVALWLELAPADARLHFISVEKFPLEHTDMARALGNWPGLATLAKELLDHYPPRVTGFHRRWLYGNRVCLTLVFDDAVSGLEALTASDHPAFADRDNPTADAWLLDGFAPAKNPDLWSPPLFRLMARLSRPGTTLATFTVARAVRDGLAAAGFETARSPGFGRKRDMLRGTFTTPPRYSANPDTARPRHRKARIRAPWYLPDQRPQADGRRAIVVGAGIAGCASAAALARRGWQVTLIDRHHKPGQEASGNPQGILYPRLSVEDLALSLFARHALCHAMTFYREFWALEGTGERCGVLVLPESERDRAHFPRIARRYAGVPELVEPLHGKALSDRAGVTIASAMGLFFPNLGWVVPPRICELLAAPCTFIQGEVSALERDKRGNWQLSDNRGSVLASAPVVVLANGLGTKTLPRTSHLPVRGIRGQISTLPATDASSNLKTVICGAGYLAPAHGGNHTLGATYDIDDHGLDVRDHDHGRNLETLAATDSALPSLFDGAGNQYPTGRAALRCTTPDYLPIAGPAPRLDDFIDCYAPLRLDAGTDIPTAGPCWPGLWLNCGHGSRGLSYGPLAAELVAAQICGEAPPLPRALATALHPGRFLIRDLKRKRL